MKEKNNILSIGNSTTIINSIIVIAAGYVFGALMSYFGSLPFTESEFVSLITTLVFALFAYINAKNHNTFWDNEEDTINIPLDSLNEQEVKALQNFINYSLSNKSDQCSVRIKNSNLDPAEIFSSDSENNEEMVDDEDGV